jgi:hypothetical protein
MAEAGKETMQSRRVGRSAHGHGEHHLIVEAGELAEADDAFPSRRKMRNSDASVAASAGDGCNVSASAMRTGTSGHPTQSSFYLWKTCGWRVQNLWRS